MLKIVTLLFKHRSIQVLLTLALYLFAARFLPDKVHQSLYTGSVLIKDLLLWILPISVGLFIAHAIASFEKRALLFLITLFLFEALSNSASVWYAYGCGHLAAAHLPPVESHPFNDTFSPLWRFIFLKPAWWTTGKGVSAGIFLGLAAALKFPALRRILAIGKEATEKLLTRFFARLIPLFVLGFVARMYKTQLLDQMLAHYADLLLWLILFLAVYIALLFFAGSGWSFKGSLKSMHNLLPAAGVSFSSGCSLSTMPWTIEGTAKNLNNPDLAKAVIPATTNVQQIGDCIAQGFLCFLIYCHFNGHSPDLSIWVPFSIVFVLARFATAAVLGGAIFIMLPIYESYLGFNAEMIAIILAFNAILDPLITSTNVIANGALCRIFEKTWAFLLRRPFAAKGSTPTR